MADVGKDVGEDGQSRLKFPRLLPADLAPPGGEDKRPDIPIVKHARLQGGRTVVHVVEVKYCMDTRMREVRAAAEAQHAALPGGTYRSEARLGGLAARCSTGSSRGGPSRH